MIRFLDTNICIYFLKGSTPYLDLVTTLDVECLGMDWTMDMAKYVPQMEGFAIQGNLDPMALYGSQDQIRRRSLEICAAGSKAKGHIFNLGHGITPKTPISNVEVLVETVQGYRREK